MLGLVIVGVSYKTTPVALRERLALDPATAQQRVAETCRAHGIAEALVVSTCNRVEVYAATQEAEDARRAVLRLFAGGDAAAAREIAAHLYVLDGVEAVRHAFRVAASLDSLVVGEAQILGQMKDALHAARLAGAAGPVLFRTFGRAFVTAKRARTDTDLGAGSVSMGSIAVELALRVFDSLQGKHVALIGAGKVARLVARHLHGQGAVVTVVNRSAERAQELAATLGGQARPLEDLPAVLADSDVVATSVFGEKPVVTRADAAKALRARRGTPVLFVDLGVPRNVDPAVRDVDGAYVYDVDDLEEVASQGRAERVHAAREAEEIVEQEVAAFVRRARERAVVPTIVALREHVHAVAREEAEKAARRVAAGAKPDAEFFAACAEAVANKVLHAPTTRLKAEAREESTALAGAVRVLFDLPDEAPGEACPVRNEWENDGAPEPGAAGSDDATGRVTDAPAADGVTPRAERGQSAGRNRVNVLIATRGSALALAQAGMVRDDLARANPGRSFELVVVKTTGDLRMDIQPGTGEGKAAFTKEIEEALLAGQARLAIHSMKDLPTDVAPALCIAGVPPREEARDALVVRAGIDARRVADMPRGASVGTGSPRRAAQVRALRPDLRVVPVRGNVDTRLRKLDEGQFDVLVIAAAGLRRLGRADRISALVEAAEIVPAVGQGALCIESRADDAEAIAWAAKLDDAGTRASVLAERALLRGLGGGCAVPIAGHARCDAGRVRLHGVVLSPDGAGRVMGDREGPASGAEEVGAALAADLLAMGARRLLEGP